MFTVFTGCLLRVVRDPKPEGFKNNCHAQHLCLKLVLCVSGIASELTQNFSFYACIEFGRHGCTLIIQCSTQSAIWDQAI